MERTTVSASHDTASATTLAPARQIKLLARHPNLIAFAILVGVLALLPLILKNNYQISVLNFIGLNTILTVGLALLMGYAGQVSLGQAVFYGLGGYGAGILAQRAGIPPFAAIVGAAVITGLIALLLGIPLLRLRGHFLAVATLGLNVIFLLIATNETDLTGGPNGLSMPTDLSLGNFVFDTDFEFYILIWLVTLAILALSLNIVNSRIGRAFRAIHSSEIAAETLGVNTARLKLQVLVLSAVYASVAGSLYAYWIGIVSPSDFSISFSIELVVMVAIGGLASVWGAIFGAAVVTLLIELLRNFLPQLLRGASGEQQIVAFGILLVLIMVLMPEGLTTGTWKYIRKWRDQKKVSNSK
ncbi:MAG: branched-chain amino acid ABC transporter permease [Anaerolineae bacterium]|nr:branched-chain amino acid ABC transporter permease [Anaerolineae bacterium]